MFGELSTGQVTPVELAPLASVPKRAGWASSTSVPNLKFDRFPKLTNQADYQLWRDSTKYRFRYRWTSVFILETVNL